MNTAYLSLGTNVGDRQANLSRAIELLSEAIIEITAESSVYETEPRDYLDQPWFLNQAVEVRTHLSPDELLTAVLGIEAALGRERTIPKGPRVIDIDILLYEDRQISTERLQIPHPAMMDRRFVLEPLVEVSPGLRNPISGVLLRDRLPGLLNQKVTKKKPDAGQASG